MAGDARTPAHVIDRGMTAEDPLLVLRDVVKNYQALRPLRIQSLTLTRGRSLALMGFDAAAAEMLVGLITGAVLPDSGTIELFGRETRAVADSEAWLALLDGVGIITDRAVLLAPFSVEQNIAMPFTLDIDPVADEVKAQVAALAEEVGLQASDLRVRIAESSPVAQARVRVARALALNPSVLLCEHPSATLPRDAVKPFAADLRRIVQQRRLGAITITADDLLAGSLGAEILTHEPASGALGSRSVWRKLFGSS
jgi:ABC-type lipoprotein export system ATPase subunit